MLLSRIYSTLFLKFEETVELFDWDNYVQTYGSEILER